MKLVAHDDEVQKFPRAAEDFLLTAVDHLASIRMIADNPQPGVAPRHYLIKATSKPDPTSPWRVPSLDAGQIQCADENKNQSLALRSHPVLYSSGLNLSLRSEPNNRKITTMLQIVRR
jgi:hypothetical protein